MVKVPPRHAKSPRHAKNLWKVFILREWYKILNRNMDLTRWPEPYLYLHFMPTQDFKPRRVKLSYVLEATLHSVRKTYP